MPPRRVGKGATEDGRRETELKLEDVVPWGRSKAEYVRMFALTERDLLLGRILDCAGGPASFNAEATGEGASVVSCDPVYRFAAEEIAGRIEETRETIVAGAKANRERYVWDEMGSAKRMGEVRMAAMRRFLEDFPRGLAEGRYLADGLPALRFAAGEFDLALCSHFLFTYSGLLTMDFHVVAIEEMCRVAKEARVVRAASNPLVQEGGLPEACRGGEKS